MGNNHSDTKKVFDFLDSDHDGFVTLNQVLHIQKLPQLENWDDCHSPLLLFRFDEGHDGALHYEEFTKLIKHLKASHQQADEPKKRRRWKEKELGKSSENLRLSLSSSGVWTSVDQNSASELDLSRDGKTPMITGRKSHMRPSCSTDDLTEEELNQLVKTEAKEFFGKFIQKSSGRKKFLTWLFHLADADKSNTISGDELKWILNALAHDGILPDNLSFDNNAVLEPTKLVQQIIDEYGTGRSAFLTKERS